MRVNRKHKFSPIAYSLPEWKANTTVTRNRIVYALLLLLTIFVGLASRQFSAHLPSLLAKNAGDILYAVMAFWLVGFLFPRLPTRHAAFAAGLFCFGIEFLKFVQMPWLVAARHTSAGALVFGRGFHVANLLCYALGVTAAAFSERLLQKHCGSCE
jgi:hypothetical protein